MTIDEAIQHCEITAKSNEKLAEFYYKDPGKNQKSGDACQECAKDHRQLAEWLRDYKRLKEREPCEDAISRQAALEICMFWWRGVGDFLHSPIAREMNELPSVFPSIPPMKEIGRRGNKNGL